MPSIRTAIFIDNSNVYQRIKDLKKIDPEWVSLYDPEELAQKLAGNKEVVFIGFYCTPPPISLLSRNERGKEAYTTQMKYFDAISKKKNVTIKHGVLTGPAFGEKEKNLDTKIATDIVTMAALNRYDIAILVSNDGDYVSPVEKVIDDFKRRVELAYFKGNVSMDLKRVCDLSKRLRRSYFVKIDLP